MKDETQDEAEEDCDKLGKDAAKCRGDRDDDRRREREKRDKEWRLKQSEYYRSQQEQIRIRNQEEQTRKYWETYESNKTEEERLRQERVEQHNRSVKE